MRWWPWGKTVAVDDRQLMESRATRENLNQVVSKLDRYVIELRQVTRDLQAARKAGNGNAH